MSVSYRNLVSEPITINCEDKCGNKYQLFLSKYKCTTEDDGKELKYITYDVDLVLYRYALFRITVTEKGAIIVNIPNNGYDTQDKKIVQLRGHSLSLSKEEIKTIVDAVKKNADIDICGSEVIYTYHYISDFIDEDYKDDEIVRKLFEVV